MGGFWNSPASVCILGASLILKVTRPSIVSGVAASLYITRLLLHGNEQLISFTQNFYLQKYCIVPIISVALLDIVCFETLPFTSDSTKQNYACYWI